MWTSDLKENGWENKGKGILISDFFIVDGISKCGVIRGELRRKRVRRYLRIHISMRVLPVVFQRGGIFGTAESLVDVDWSEVLWHSDLTTTATAPL